jgi:DNA (cytosine-5)-methyltransferase 1
MGESTVLALRSLELFTGAGGLALGSHDAHFEHVALVEWDDDACKTLRENVEKRTVPGIDNWWVLHQDATKIRDFGSFGKVDVIIGGPPCQPFSVGGKHGGREDSRDMIPTFIKAIRELKPRAFIIENVRGLLRPAFEDYFHYTYLQLKHPGLARTPDEDWMRHLERLEKAETSGRRRKSDYNVIWRPINAADFGIPQVRNRVFIVGFNAELGVKWHFPEPTHGREALWRDQWETGVYWERHGLTPPRGAEADIIMKALRPVATKRKGSGHKTPELPWQTVRDAFRRSPALPGPGDGADPPGFRDHRYIPGARPYYGHSGSLHDLPAKTLKAGVHGVPGGENTLVISPEGDVRYFTVRESARLQTFPDTWRLEGAWGETMRQLGNAVPVDLAKLIAASVSDKLMAGDGDGR